jgi:type I restriction enzyme R subunit
MPSVGQREIRTQQRVLAFFREALGYAYLGHWQDREGNPNVEEALLTAWLKRRGHSEKIIAKVLFELGKAVALGGS